MSHPSLYSSVFMVHAEECSENPYVVPGKFIILTKETDDCLHNIKPKYSIVLNTSDQLNRLWEVVNGMEWGGGEVAACLICHSQ